MCQKILKCSVSQLFMQVKQMLPLHDSKGRGKFTMSNFSALYITLPHLEVTYFK